MLLAEIENTKYDNKVLMDELDKHHKSNLELLEKIQKLGFDFQKEKLTIEETKMHTYMSSLNDIKRSILGELNVKN